MQTVKEILKAFDDRDDWYMRHPESKGGVGVNVDTESVREMARLCDRVEFVLDHMDADMRSWVDLHRTLSLSKTRGLFGI